MRARATRALAAVTAGALASLSAHAGPGPTGVAEMQVLGLLGSFDEAPDPAALQALMGPDVALHLAALAADPGVDTGVRLRAIRAMAAFPGEPVHAALVSLFESLQGAAAGAATVLLRATMESLADVGGDDDVARIVPVLQNPTRDLRAAAAHALRVLDSPLALDALFAQQAVETSPQVRNAILEALRAILSDG